MIQSYNGRVADQYEVVYDLFIAAMVDDLEQPISHISRSR